MRIQELATEQHRTKLIRELKRIGYKKIGQGVDAMVFRKDTTHVIKFIFPRLIRDLPESNKIFLYFYEFCKNNPSKNLPKFSSVNEIEIDGEDFLQISMEHLYPLDSGSDDESIVWGLSYLAENNTAWEDVKKQLSSYDFWHNVKKPNLENLENYKNLYLDMIKLNNNLPKGAYSDIHTENVMKRSDGTLVITDPWTV